MLTLPLICQLIQAGCTPGDIERMRREAFEERGKMEIKIGQIWRDCDKRVERTLEVIGLPNDLQVLVLCIETGKTTRIQRHRMKLGARGYELVKDVE